MLARRPYPLIFLCSWKYRYLTPPFERPEFQRMMDDTKDGKINCILTKDLSRFGREASQIGTYLDFTFPNMGVICIAVHEE